MFKFNANSKTDLQMKKQTKKQQLKLYYHLILFAGILIIIANWLLFTLLFDFNDNRRVVISYQRRILDHLKSKLSYSSNSNENIQPPLNKLPAHELFEYSTKFNLWTITTTKLPVIVRNDDKLKPLYSPGNATNLHPRAVCDLAIWPNINNSSGEQQSTLSHHSDRIIEQLIYQPQCLDANNQFENYDKDTILKIRPDRLDLESNQNFFIQEACTVDKCEITYDWNEADALIFKVSLSYAKYPR